MAMVGIEFSTHPELPEALVCNLMLKRVNVGNFMSDFLRYRDANGNPTNDPKDAFWLNRAIDMYIDKYINDGFLDWGGFGSVFLKYNGSNAQLKKFKDREKLSFLDLNDGNKTFVSQVTYGIYHKFHFCRLIGESYPTVQHMGTSSGELRLSIVTTNIEQFTDIHSYKSAADFFVRHSENITKFNGWDVDTYLVRLLNFTPNKLAVKTNASDIDSAFYPSQIISTTNDELPGLHDVAITFQATNPKFFEDFGFTIENSQHNVDSLYRFYSYAYDQAIKARETISKDGISALLEPNGALDMYSFRLFFGNGDDKDRMMLINPDTLMALLLEKEEYKEGKKQFEWLTKDTNTGEVSIKLYDSLYNNEYISGELNVEGGPLDATGQEALSLFKEVNKRINPFASAPDITIPNELAARITDVYFTVSSPSRETIIKYIEHIAEPYARRALFNKLFIDNGVKFNTPFRDKLFSAIVLRRNESRFNRVYDRSGVIKAFHALSIAYDAKGEEFFPEPDNSTYVKGKTKESKITIDNNGKLHLSDTVTTCYNDYMYITYDELFTLSDIPEAEDETRWKKYAVRYKDVGALNNDLKFFEEKSTWDHNAILKAQNQLISTISSPVPPDVFFYKKYELDQTHVDSDDKYSEWFNKHKELILEIPFDIEDLERDNRGNTTGATSINPSIPPSGKQLSSLIEENIEYHRKKTGANNKWKEMALDVMALEMRNLIDQKQWTFQEIKNAISNKDSQKLEKLKSDIAKFKGSSGDGLLVPFVQGRGLKSPLARYEKLTGIAGAGVARVITQIDDEEIFETYIAETITRSADGSLTGMSVTNANLEESRAAMMRVIQAIPDNGDSLAKAFPVMRLYLIEERGPNLLVQDNFYGYHAIDSIDITLDKEDAGLAVIRVADPFRILQGSSFDISGKSNDLKNTVTMPTDGVSDENLQDRVKLRQGRHIQIRGGYSSSAEHLDVIFNGRIAEVQFGDMVTIVAQGWKAEIAGKQVNFEGHATNDNSVKDLVVRTILEANPKGFGQYFSGREFSNISKVIGDLSGAEQVMQSRLNLRGTYSNASSGGANLELAGFSLLKNIGSGVDMKLKNVWVPDKDPMRWALFKDAVKNGWQGTRWVVPMSSAWDVLQTATNYVWGYICQVVPFDSEATLFFGKPESLYYYTTGDKRVGQATRMQQVQQHEKVKKFIVPAIRYHVYRNWDPVIDGYYASPTRNGFVISKEKKTEILYSDYKEYYKKLYNIFGNDTLVAIVLLSSFTGLSTQYIQKQINDPVSLVKILLSKDIPSHNPYIREVFEAANNKQAIDRLNDSYKTILEDKGKGKYSIEEIDDLLSGLKGDAVETHLENFRIDPTNNKVLSNSFPSDIIKKAFRAVEYFDEAYTGGPDFGRINSTSWARHIYPGYEGQRPWKVSIDKGVSEAIDALSLIKEDYVNKNITQKSLTKFFDPDFVDIANKIDPYMVSNLEDAENIGNVIIDKRYIFKTFVRSLSEYVVSNQNSSEVLQEAIGNSKNLFAFDPRLIHNMKVFRDYHYIRNDRDILSNDIAATTREMHNTVVVKYPEELNTSNDSWWKFEWFKGNYDDTQIEASTTWTSWPRSADGHIGMQFDDSITLEDKKIGVYRDLNITRKEQASIAATNVLAKMMRPMYRNSITILGRIVKPWDYVYIDDKYTDMRGMVDVERVVHHYSASTGWTTRIVPHAICEANPGNRQIQAAAFESKMDTIYNASEIVLDTIVYASMIPTLGASLEAGIALKASSIAFKEGIIKGLSAVATDTALRSAGKGVLAAAASNIPTALKRYIAAQGALYIGDFSVNSISMNMRAGAITLPVVLSPLKFKGIPLQAGIHGTDETYWSLGSRLHWSLKSLGVAYDEFLDSLSIGNDGTTSNALNILSLSSSNEI